MMKRVALSQTAKSNLKRENKGHRKGIVKSGKKKLQNHFTEEPDCTSAEFAEHKELSYKLGCEIYSAYPCHSWDRGLPVRGSGSEQTHQRAIRQYLPTGTSFEGLTQRQLDRIVEKIKAYSPSSSQGCEDTGLLAEVFSEHLFARQN
jgi:IS30 family transposase